MISSNDRVGARAFNNAFARDGILAVSAASKDGTKTMHGHLELQFQPAPMPKFEEFFRKRPSSLGTKDSRR